jgi:hypothetical protein
MRLAGARRPALRQSAIRFELVKIWATISNLLIASDLRSDPDPRAEPIVDLKPGNC